VKPYYSNGEITLYHGDCREVVPGLSDIDYIVTDPPYGIGFMDKDWDTFSPEYLQEHRTADNKRTPRTDGRKVAAWKNAADAGSYDYGRNHEFQAWFTVIAKLCRAACKPGAMLAAFGGPRTWHRLACAVEDAGWEIRDCCMFLFGSGFPKSHNISKAIDKATGAEREVVGIGSNYGHDTSKSIEQQFGYKADYNLTAPATDAAKEWSGWGTALKPAWEPIILAMNPLDGTFAHNATEHGVAGLNIDAGRIGTDTILQRQAKRVDGGSGIGAKAVGQKQQLTGIATTTQGRWPANLLLDEEAGAMLDAQSGERHAGGHLSGTEPSEPGKNVYGKYGRHQWDAYRDSGGASRFFYTAKANAEREPYNNHPTLKPVCLMQYLLRLLSAPTGGVILDPFAGSGTTLLAAKRLQRACIGIEKEEAYCEIAARRLAEDAPLFAEPPRQDEPPELFPREDAT